MDNIIIILVAIKRMIEITVRWRKTIITKYEKSQSEVVHGQ